MTKTNNKREKALEITEFRELMDSSVSSYALKKLTSYIPLANKNWERVMKRMFTYEKVARFPFKYKNESKLYALDGVAIADLFGLKKISKGLMLYSIFYLCAHVLDDMVEDPKKFKSKFNYHNNLEENALGVGFFLISYLNIMDVTTDLAVLKKFINNLASQILYFTLEQERLFSPRKVLRLKERKINGKLTSFIADCLGIDDENIKKALLYLGSLTQFTDDVRDYSEDKKNGNINLLLSLENHYGVKEGRETFIRWYKKEEEQMRIKLLKSGINNIEIIKAIPWHPFFLRP